MLHYQGPAAILEPMERSSLSFQPMYEEKSENVTNVRFMERDDLIPIEKFRLNFLLVAAFNGFQYLWWKFE